MLLGNCFSLFRLNFFFIIVICKVNVQVIYIHDSKALFKKQGLSYSIMSFTYISIYKNSGRAASIPAIPELILIYPIHCYQYLKSRHLQCLISLLLMPFLKSRMLAIKLCKYINITKQDGYVFFIS